jgi:hypothetical protein
MAILEELSIADFPWKRSKWGDGYLRRAFHSILSMEKKQMG